MEERIGTVIILVNNREVVPRLNQIISQFSDIIIGRQGIRLIHKDKSIISLLLEGNTDQLGALTGQLGRLEGIETKSVLLKSNLNDRNPH